jgi:tight adherence protein C
METLPLLPYFASVLLFGCVVLFVLQLTPRRDALQKLADLGPIAVVRGSLAAQRQELIEKYPLYRLILPIISWLGALHARLDRQGYTLKMQARLSAAGNPGAFTPDEIFGLRVVLAVVLPVLTYLFLSAAMILQDGGRGLVLAGAALAGFAYPSLWIADQIAKRAQTINRGLPYVLDLLTLAVEAGLDFISAVERIVSKRTDRDPLTDELFLMLQELKMGKTRREALRDMAHRCRLENIDTVVAALIQADQLGTSMGPVLRIQAEMLRVRRSQRAEKLAMEAPVKMIFPLLFIFTSVFLLLFGPTLVRILRDGLF